MNHLDIAPPVRQHSDGAVQHLRNHPRHRQSQSDRCHRPRQGQFRGVGWGVGEGVQGESLGHRPPVRQHSDGAVQHLRNHPWHRQSQSDRCHRPRQGQFTGWGLGGGGVRGVQREPLGHRPPVRQHSDGAVQHLRNHPRHRQSQSDRCHRPRQGQFAGWGLGGEGGSA